MECPFRKTTTYYDKQWNETTQSEAVHSEEIFKTCKPECRAYSGGVSFPMECLRMRESK